MTKGIRKKKNMTTPAKTMVMNYDNFVVTLIALSHLRKEYEAHLADCLKFHMDEDVTFWNAKIAIIDATYNFLSHDIIDIKGNLRDSDEVERTTNMKVSFLQAKYSTDGINWTLTKGQP
jgi:hypothetical protein